MICFYLEIHAVNMFKVYNNFNVVILKMRNLNLKNKELEEIYLFVLHSFTMTTCFCSQHLSTQAPLVRLLPTAACGDEGQLLHQ